MGGGGRTDVERAGQEAWAANKAGVALKGKGVRKECFEGQRHTPENKSILGNGDTATCSIHFGIMWTKQSALWCGHPSKQKTGNLIPFI